MAEIAIPLLALGGLYIASNKNDTRNSIGTMREGFKSNNNNMQYSYPTINQEPVINYPTTQDVKNSNVRKYPNANQSTDKYFNEKTYENIGMNQGAQQNFSLSGQPIDKSNFKHNINFFTINIKTINFNIFTKTYIFFFVRWYTSYIFRIFIFISK